MCCIILNLACYNFPQPFHPIALLRSPLLVFVEKSTILMRSQPNESVLAWIAARQASTLFITALTIDRHT
jgi:hypothetical protein